MDIEDFKELGLSKNEAKIYKSLVKHGKMGSTELSSKSGVPYGRIYDFIGGLTEKGLIKVIPGKTKKFVAADPKELIKLVEEKEKFLSNLKEEANKFKKFYDTKESEVVQVAYGDKGFWKIIEEMPKVKNYSYGVRWDFKIRQGNIERVRKNLKKGLDLKNLTRFDGETEKTVKKWKKSFPNIRILDNEGVALSIQDDNCVLIGLIKSNSTLLIKDKSFAKVMKKMFSETYKNANEVK